MFVPRLHYFLYAIVDKFNLLGLSAVFLNVLDKKYLNLMRTYGCLWPDVQIAELDIALSGIREHHSVTCGLYTGAEG